jgi:hypothetical protein
MELVMEDDRVEGTREGVALLEALLKLDEFLLQSLTLRDSEGKRLSILLLMLFTEGSNERRRLAMRISASTERKYSFWNS